MLTNRKLLSTQIGFFKVFIAFHFTYFLFFCLSYINRNYLNGEMFPSEWGRVIGQFMAFLWGTHQILNLLSLIFLIVWFYRSNKNVKALHAAKGIHPFWLFTFWIVPFMEIIFPVLFLRRYVSVMEKEFKVDRKKYSNKYWLILVLGIIGYLLGVFPFVGPYFAQVLRAHEYLVVFGALMWIKPVFLIGYCALWLILFRELQKIDQQLIAKHTHESYLNESVLIDD